MTSLRSWTLSDAPAGLSPLRLLVLTNDVPGREVNVLTEETLLELDQRLSEVERAQPDGLVIISGKPGGFIAGADIEAIKAVRTEAEGATKSALGQRLLRRLSEMPFPTVAAIHGACVGGGAELACWCTARTCSTDDRTRIGFPEVRLGIVPGFGGTQRLPAIVGLAQATTLAASAKLLAPRQALRVGLVDSVVPREHLLREAAALVARERARPSRRFHASSLPLVRDVVAALARRRIAKEAAGHYPAPLEAARLCRRSLTTSLDAGLAEEASALGRLVVSPVAASLLHVYDLTRAAEAGGIAPPAGALVGVLGAGVMGGGIAGLASAKGFRARLRDVAEGPLAAGVAAATDVVTGMLKSSWRREVTVRSGLDRLSWTLTLEGFGDADLVVEAVVEREDVKKAVLAEAQGAIGRGCLLATNTSSLSVARLAGALDRRDLFVGLHFFNPVSRMPLVEVVRGPETSDAAVARAIGWAKALGKHPVVTTDSPGFLVNRLLAPYLGEALRLHDEGLAIEAIDAAARAFGMPMGPFRLLDEVGLDVAAHVQATFTQAWPDRFPQSVLIRRLVDERRLGKKVGHGFYDHGPGRARPWSGLRRTADTAKDAVIQDRLFLPMADEAFRCLHEGVVASPRDVDLATVMGIGFPPFRGGLLAWVRDMGPKVALSRLQALAVALGPRLAPCRAFKDVAAGGPWPGSEMIPPSR